ncbi:MAG: putative toxin-antitoxin system toxin component, PIN family [Kiritimatiellae bacterium]|nr:putative toxin-antitoxin system toxin component, PIN family [Kiritimatiellia bacterium]
MRAVLDTNVVISAIFFGGMPLKIVRAAFAKKVELVASRAVLREYREVAERLHVQFPSVNYRRPLSILESKLIIVRPVALGETVCRDPDDDAIIACALGGKAKVICSGDDDLLALNGFRGLEIMQPSDFCQRMKI